MSLVFVMYNIDFTLASLIERNQGKVICSMNFQLYSFSTLDGSGSL